MVAKCCECKLSWNVSIKADLSEEYVCPWCRNRMAREERERAAKEKKLRELKKGRVSNVLLRNRKKFQA